MIDYTSTHSQQFVDAQGQKHLIIKPLRIEKKLRPDGTIESVNIVVPRLSLKPKANPI